jgi:hypothetical protein
MNFTLPFAFIPWGSEPGGEIMCPACLATAAMIAMTTAGVASAGGVGVILAKTFRAKANRATRNQINPTDWSIPTNPNQSIREGTR